jgi:hypothetical protein
VVAASAALGESVAGSSNSFIDDTAADVQALRTEAGALRSSFKQAGR